MEKLVANPDREDCEVFHSLARIMISPDARVDFEDSGDSEADLSFVSNIDNKNFELVPKGSHMGFAKDANLIWVEDNKGTHITDHFLKVKDGELITNRLFIPSMFTKDVYVMKEDCLGYIMELMVPSK